MGTTDNNIFFPDPASTPSRSQLQQMAESVDAAIAPQPYSAAEVGVSAGTNWSIANFTAIRIGVLRVIQMQLSYSGSTITANSAGDIPNQNVLTGIPSDWMPSFSTSFAYDAGATGGFGTIGSVFSLRTAMPNSTITSGTTVIIGVAYVALG